MSDTVITTELLVKAYGRGKKRAKAVDHLSLSVSEGQVYGFLGPNGAGKSTTIRILLGLARPSSGSAQIFNTPVARADTIRRERVGALVEGSTFYNFLSGRQNLEVLARNSNCYDPARIDELLELVGMRDAADRKVKTYSTGMKQRTGIAAALLNDPELVILDEPTNGLDPQGIQEIRQLVRSLVDDYGKTVFISSHILHEIEQVCDRVAIIKQGRLLKEGTVNDLLNDQTSLRIETDDARLALQALGDHWSGAAEKGWVQIRAPRSEVPDIARKLVNAEVPFYQIVQERRSLEEYFLEVTGSNGKVAVASHTDEMEESHA